MKKLSLFLILICLYTPKAYSQLYPGNAYYDSTGKVYYYATDGKAYYYPEHVQRQYQKKPQTTHTVRRVSSPQNTKQHQQKANYVTTKKNNLVDENWWKNITLERLKQEIKNPNDLKITGSIKTASDDMVSGATPIMYALKNNANIDIINFLIQQGVDVNAENDKGASVLSYSAHYNANPEIIKILIDAGADVNAKDDDGWTALMYAAMKNTNPEIIKILIDAGADVNAKSDGGWTALMRAAEYNENAEVIKILIDAGADVNAKDDDGWTALMYAAMKNTNPEIIKILIDAGADVNAKTNPGATALIGAAMKNTNPEVIKTLLDSGADINTHAQNYAFITAAFYALGINPNHKIFELLVKKDIDNFCKVNRSYSEEIYYCKDRLTLYMQKEASLPSCTKNPSAMLAIFPFVQGLQYIDSDKGTYTLVVFADRMSHFNCSISKTFKEMHFYDFE